MNQAIQNRASHPINLLTFPTQREKLLDLPSILF